MKKSVKIGFGTAAIGRPQYINIKQNSNAEISLEAFRANGKRMIDSAYLQGIRYFDTAPGYGLAEDLLIDWIKDKDDESIEIATKWGYTYTANFDQNATQHEVKEHSLKKLNEQWNQSKRLSPFLSTYQIHSATLDTGVLDNDEVLHRLLELKNEHGILIGLTTTSSNQLEVLKKALDVEVEGTQIFEVFQVTYNIFDQSLANMSEQLSNQNKRIVIKEALANGRIFPNENFPNYSKAHKKLIELSEKYETGIDAIALRFCMDSISVFKVLSGATNIQHLTDNLQVSNFELEKNDISVLKELLIDPEQYWSERKKLTWN